ncbi:MAG: peptidoglycan DD-metalloendopeptidase family protein [Candidatus Pacebacteria bacterium]|jgi:murein DD-endopeptidase MepM/ murein hydrolase activator NlpD|nr:peptidoglycan DD-metalloendopeptidase family protein [Candidatus Paceibacterota bacterium]
MRVHRFNVLAFVCGLLLVPALWWGSYDVSAQSTEVDKLKQEINERSQRLLDIEKEIAQFEADLKKVGAEKNTLQKAINQLELERKKVQADIRFTEQKIQATDLELSKLILEIQATEEDIESQKNAISEIIRRRYKTEKQTMVEVMLQHKHLSEFWSSLDTMMQVQSSMAEKVEELDSMKLALSEKRGETEDRRGLLVDLKDQYGDQSSVLANNQAERAELLSATRNKESEYQKLIKDKQSAREQILKEMRDYEAKLQFILDPTTIPAAGTAVFAWPLKNVIITQYFGGTEFARRNASVYGGRAYHPGVDFGAPRGTPIYAPLAGTVRATGNTDAVPGCWSWGKWTLIDHANGLSTLYAHQDTISVVPGQRVATGEIIGYVGNTGFSTGPHLHFTVYAKDGVNVRRFNEIKTSTSCGAATTPVAATEAYLDPMLYLPPY